MLACLRANTNLKIGGSILPVENKGKDFSLLKKIFTLENL
jgi:hypothetical protein